MKKIAEALLEIGAVEIRSDFSFTWASGIQSPVYCDNRLLLSYPTLREEVAQEFKNCIEEKYPEVEVIAGTATAGIPHAAIIAHDMDLPMVYVRSKPKDHGKQNLIEGRLNTNARVVVIEDLISTGKSSLQVVEALKAQGADVLGVVSIFSYRLKSAEDAFQKASVRYDALTDFVELLTLAVEQKRIKNEDLDKILSWIKNY